jgi:hypothetical protein
MWDWRFGKKEEKHEKVSEIWSKVEVNGGVSREDKKEDDVWV